MQNRKSGCWTFIFSLIPGAGQMYLGATKKGVVLMGGFFFWLFLSSLFYWDSLNFFLPIIWFYSFFDVLNTKQLPPEELKASENRFFDDLSKIFGGSLKNTSFSSFVSSRRVGIVIIVLGVLGLLEGAVFPVFRWMVHDSLLYRVIECLPSVIICVLIIAFGVHMLNSGKKKDYIEFTETKDPKDDNE